MAAILHVVDFCIKTATSQPDGINRLPLEVGEDSMNRSTIIMNHLINVKYILCPPATPEESVDISGMVENERNIENEKIRKIITHLETSVSPSLVSRKSWCLPVNGKYPVQSAIHILKRMEDLGLGSLREISHPHNNKKSNCLLKPSTISSAMIRVPLCFHFLFQKKNSTLPLMSPRSDTSADYELSLVL